MFDIAHAIVLSVFTLATSIWVGGYIAIAVVARVAARTLLAPERVAFFRLLGRTYGMVGGAALFVAVGTGAALLRHRPWDAQLVAAALLATALIGFTAVGMAQARRMTRLRRAETQRPNDQDLAMKAAKGARVAILLRALIGLLSSILIALGSVMAS
jgi:uncharacterized membrane protein